MSSKRTFDGVLNVSLSELNLLLTLPVGQSFRWRKLDDTSTWLGVIKNYVCHLRQNQNSGQIEFKIYNCQDNDSDPPKKRFKFADEIDTNLLGERILSDYFNLDVSLSQLLLKWTECDDSFKRISSTFGGIRLLRQEPVETLMSFICSSNNNIKRISSMVEKMCTKFGKKLMDHEEIGPIYSFPDLATLADDSVESELRKLGFGYRAKYISKTAKTIVSKNPSNPEDWLFSLRKLPYEDAFNELVTLSGVGYKVADCVCLMCLDKRNAVPIDTHIYKIASSQYLPLLKKQKTLTDKNYKLIGDFFRSRFGENAGWAQSILFCSDLREFQAKNKLKVAKQ